MNTSLLSAYDFYINTLLDSKQPISLSVTLDKSGYCDSFISLSFSMGSAMSLSEPFTFDEVNKKLLITVNNISYLQSYNLQFKVFSTISGAQIHAQAVTINLLEPLICELNLIDTDLKKDYSYYLGSSSREISFKDLSYETNCPSLAISYSSFGIPSFNLPPFFSFNRETKTYSIL